MYDISNFDNEVKETHHMYKKGILVKRNENLTMLW